MSILEDKHIIPNDTTPILHDANGRVEKEGYLYELCHKRLCAESLLEAQGHVEEAKLQGRLSRHKSKAVIHQIGVCLSILQRDCETRVLLMADYLTMGEFLDSVDHKKEEADGKASIRGDSEFSQFG